MAQAAAETLQNLGYRVAIAGSGTQAWKKFADAPLRFDLILADHVMPGMTGLMLAEKMLEVRSDLPIILFTGYSGTVSPEIAEAKGISGFLMKPVVAAELAEEVRRVLDRRDKG